MVFFINLISDKSGESIQKLAPLLFCRRANGKNFQSIFSKAMKRIILLILILSVSIGFVCAQTPQQKPLTQTEFVKMLYDLQKSSGNKTVLVEAIRTRGIGFELTDGLRSLTRTKGKNDEELQRTLEEANRRRQNPATAKLPSEKEAAEILAKAREATLTAIDEMPDFVAKQLISRSTAYAGTNNWKSLDKLTIAVSYSTTKGEQYRVLAINGTPVSAEKGNNYGGLDGATTVGEFVETLSDIFKEERKTKFQAIDTDVLRNRQTVIYEYEILLKNGRDAVGLKSLTSTSTVRAGQKGKIWVDRNTFRVLRIENELTELPVNYGVKALTKIIDYDWVEIAGVKYLLPVLSDAKFTIQASGLSGILVQDRNLIRFKDYQKYGTEIIISDDEDEVKPEKP